MGRSNSQEGLVRAAFHNMIRGVYTAMPCVVVTVHDNLDQQKVDVKPLINMFGRGGEVKERPTIYSVPVQFPASKTSGFTFPLTSGDVVLCVFSMRGMEAFKSGDGTPKAPFDYSDYAEKDAVAIPGLFPFDLAINNPSKRTLEHSTDDAVVTHNIGTAQECEVRFKSNGDIKIISPEAVSVECKTATVNASESAQVDTPTLTVNADNTTWTGDMTFTGDIGISGELTLDGVVVNMHDHAITSGSSSPGPTGPMQ